MRGSVAVILLLIFLTIPLAYGSPPEPGSEVFVVQVGSLKDRERAFKLAERLKAFPDVRVSYRNGRYKVRIGFFKTYKEAVSFTESAEFKDKVKDFYVTKIVYHPEGVFFLPSSKSEEKPQEKRRGEPEQRDLKEELELEPNSYSSAEGSSNLTLEQGEVEAQPTVPDEVKSDFEKALEEEGKENASPVQRDKQKGKDEKGSWLKEFYLLFLFVLVILFIIRFLKDNQNSENYIENHIAKLLGEGKYEEVIEVAIPYLDKNPNDTFVKNALAESYEMLGKYLEAASVYSEIAQDLEKKGLNILAEGFKERAEKLYSQEFKRGG